MGELREDDERLDQRLRYAERQDAGKPSRQAP